MVPSIQVKNDLLETPVIVMIMDELGKTESNSQSLLYHKAVTEAFENRNVVVVGTVPVALNRACEGDRWLEALKKRHDTLILEVNKENRSSIHEDILRLINIHLDY